MARRSKHKAKVIASLIGLLLQGAFFIFTVSFRFVATANTRKRYRAVEIGNIDTMEGLEFERYLAYLFQELGYRVTVTKGSGDQGADLLLEKDGMRTVVQAKRYNNKVSNHAVQQVIAGREFYNAQTAIVVTNNDFTNSAKQLAQKTRVDLWDRNKLGKMILMISSARDEAEFVKIKDILV